MYQSGVQYTPIARGQIVSNVEILNPLRHGSPTAVEFLDGFTNFTINPGNADLFPWLSKMALLYEYYKFRKLVVHFNPDVGTNVSGHIVIAADYDPRDQPPDTEAQLMAYAGAMRASVWYPCKWVGDVKSMFHQGSAKIVSAANLSDPLRSCGELQIYQYVSQPTNPGIYRVEYVVELLNPQPFRAGDQTLEKGGEAVFQQTVPKTITAESGNAYGVLNGGIAAAINTLGIPLEVQSDGSITLPAGFWEFHNESTQTLDVKTEVPVATIQYTESYAAPTPTVEYRSPYVAEQTSPSLPNGATGYNTGTSGAYTNFFNLATAFRWKPIVKYFLEDAGGRELTIRSARAALRYIDRYQRNKDIDGNPIVE